MHFSFDVAGPVQPQAPITPRQAEVPADALELLRQILEVQKEQLHLSRAMVIANDGGHRWRTFLSRWNEQFPDIAAACKQVLPQIERAYMEIMNELSERLRDDGPHALDNEFDLSEFLDKYGMRLGQLGQIMNLVTPIAEAYVPPQPAEEAAGEQS